MNPPTDFARVYTAVGMLQANLVKSMLEAASLPVLVYGESAATVYGFTVGDMARVELWVPVDRLVEAEEMVSRLDEAGEADRTEVMDEIDGEPANGH
ncbi:MAG: DUF2007 domain-containing protein [Chloroflexi bacterium]|nr:DUF2007 domain-containing protein [Chloroflexota bacterium]